MSILIKGMEMPKSCGDCKAFVCYRQWAGDLGECFCGITKNDAKAKEKNTDCPLVSVPLHGDLIDRDALMLRVDIHGTNKFGMLDEDIRQFIGDAPTIIPTDHEEEEMK